MSRFNLISPRYRTIRREQPRNTNIRKEEEQRPTISQKKEKTRYYDLDSRTCPGIHFWQKEEEETIK